MGRHGPERHDDEGRQEERAMKLGLSIGYSGAELTLPVEKVLLAERLGFDSVWTAEAYGSDAISPLAYLAAVTKRIRLGTGIMQLAARPPVSAAMAAGTLDALAGGGRVIAGLGVSGPQIVSRTQSSRIRRREREDDHRRRGHRRPPETGRGARRDGDKLLAIDLVRDDPAVHRAPGGVPVEDAPVPRVEDEEVAAQLTSEQEIGRRHGDGGEHRAARFVAPANGAGRGVDRGQRSPPLLPGIAEPAPAHVGLSQEELLGLPEGAAPVHRGDVERVRPRAEGRSIPLHPTERARADVHSLAGERDVDVLPAADRDLVEVFATLAVQDMEQSVLAGHRDEPAGRALHLGAEERAHLRRIPSVIVVWHDLVVPRELPSARVEDDQAIGVQVRALTDMAVEIGRRIAHGNEHQPAHGIEGEGRPEDRKSV